VDGILAQKGTSADHFATELQREVRTFAAEKEKNLDQEKK